MHAGDPRPGPRDQFLNERPYQVSDRTMSSWIGVWMAVALHLALLVTIAPRIGSVPRAPTVSAASSSVRLFYVGKPDIAHGGGGGGGPERAIATPAQSPGRDATTLRAMMKSPVPAPGFTESVPTQVVQVPEVSTAAGLQQLPGVMATRQAPDAAVRGSGSGLGADGGGGDGQGPGRGPGRGDGQGGLEGTGPMHPGGDVSWPRLLRDSKPQYTADALRAHAQGLIELRVEVLADGSVGGVDIVRGFQPPFWLDAEAIKAVRNWRFEPARQRGRPVAVVVPVELSFTLR